MSLSLYTFLHPLLLSLELNLCSSFTARENLKFFSRKHNIIFKNYHLLAVSDCLFHIFSVTLYLQSEMYHVIVTRNPFNMASRYFKFCKIHDICTLSMQLTRTLKGDLTRLPFK